MLAISVMKIPSYIKLSSAKESVCMLSCSVVSDSLQPQGLWSSGLLCPWDSPGKNTRVDSHALLPRIFPTQGLNPGLLHCRQILYCLNYQFSSVQFSHSIMSDYLWPRGLQHTRSPCRSPFPRAWSNSWPLSWWCHSIISSSVIPFSSHLQSFNESFQMSQFSASSG